MCMFTSLNFTHRRQSNHPNLASADIEEAPQEAAGEQEPRPQAEPSGKPSINERISAGGLAVASTRLFFRQLMAFFRQLMVSIPDKVLSTTASLSQLLPTGTVLAYHCLSSSFANQLGACYTANKCLSGFLIGLCALSCILFTFTDSVRGGDDKIYYGIASCTKLILFNNGSDEDNVPSEDELKKYRLRLLDYIYAILSVLLFLAVAFGDVAVSRCLFPDGGPEAKKLLLRYLPLGAILLSSTFFLISPTHRNGIGYTN